MRGNYSSLRGNFNWTDVCKEAVQEGFLAGSGVSEGVSAREERRGDNTIQNYDVLTDSGIESSSHQAMNSTNMSSISCCHLVAKLCQYTCKSCRISFDETSSKLPTASKKQRYRLGVFKE